MSRIINKSIYSTYMNQASNILFYAPYIQLDKDNHDYLDEISLKK